MKHNANETSSSGHHTDSHLHAHSCQHEHEPRAPDVESTEVKAGDAMGLAYLIVPGMGSDHCAGLVKASLMRLEGVVSVESNIALHRVSVHFNTQRLQLMDLQRAVEKCGYEVDSICGANASQLSLTVPDMGSDHCAGLIGTSIKRLPGIYTVSTNIGTHKVVVDFDRQSCSTDMIEQAVIKAGYEVAAAQEGTAKVAVDDDSEKQANVGIAIGAGADVAIEAADVTLVRGELSKLVEAIRLSKATFRKILENLFWAWIYNLAAIPIAALGLLHPMVGVIAMTASSLTVIGNSLLLKSALLEVRK